MTISTAVDFRKILDTTQWEIDGIHPSSLPNTIPIPKRLFRNVNIETEEKKIEAINNVVKIFLWENRYTFNEGDSRWRRDANYLVKSPRENLDLRERLQREASL